jgi:hypothetical protein
MNCNLHHFSCYILHFYRLIPNVTTELCTLADHGRRSGIKACSLRQMSIPYCSSIQEIVAEHPRRLLASMPMTGNPPRVSAMWITCSEIVRESDSRPTRMKCPTATCRRHNFLVCNQTWAAASTPTGMEGTTRRGLGWFLAA